MLIFYKCALCGFIVKRTDYGVCQGCYKKLFSPKKSSCQRCGGTLISESTICWDCRSGNLLNIPVKGLFPYKSLGGELLRLYKFEKWKNLGHFFAMELLKLGVETWPIVLVPPSKNSIRYWEPVSFLGQTIRKLQGINILKPIKFHNKIKQKSLTKNQRISRVVSLSWTQKKVPEKVILLDDVITTGATINTCAKLLKSFGVKEIQGVCVCIR